MKYIGLITIAVFLAFISSHLYSNEKAPESSNRSYVMFSEIMSSGGSTGCPSKQSISLINTYSELSDAYKNLYACSTRSDSEIEPPKIDLKVGSAVLLDMGAQGYLGNHIIALRMINRDSTYALTFVTLEAGEGCWRPAITQRPFQLIYVEEKIKSLDTHHIEGYMSCDDQ